MASRSRPPPPDCAVCRDTLRLHVERGALHVEVACPRCQPQAAREAELTAVHRRMVETVLAVHDVASPWAPTLVTAIRPGTEPGPGANVEDAMVTLGVFLAQLAGAEQDVWTSYLRVPAADEAGRFAVQVHGGGGCVLLEMPGHPVWQVRPAGRSPWDFPRLIVDGKHCLWDEAAALVFKAIRKRKVGP